MPQCQKTIPGDRHPKTLMKGNKSYVKETNHCLKKDKQLEVRYHPMLH